MNRRQLIAATLVLAVPPAQAAMPNAGLTLIDGGVEGDARLAGVALRLDAEWKTYWRMPGEAGVPPEFDWSSSANLAKVEVLYPLPQRFADAGGETVGYKHDVVFPLRLYPADPAAAIDLRLSLFLGICKDVCVPVRLQAEARLAGEGAGEASRLHGWLARVPVPAGDPPPIRALTLALESGKPALILALSAPVDDIFVEGEGSAYYRKPDLAADGLSARIAIDNVKDGEVLRGRELLFTVASGGRGLEQRLTVS
jgi:DsbC/DsbD-like thiol-disulfide interchange protein